MLERASNPREEDSVKNMISKAFETLWFGSSMRRSPSVPVGGARGKQAGAAAKVARSSTVPLGAGGAPLNGNGSPPSATALVDPSTVQMVALQAEYVKQNKKSSWLSPLLDRMLGLAEESVTQAARDRAAATCKRLVDDIVAYILLLFEVRVEQGGMSHSAAASVSDAFFFGRSNAWPLHAALRAARIGSSFKSWGVSPLFAPCVSRIHGGYCRTSRRLHPT